MNQITLPARELKEALSGLAKVVSRRSTLPVLSTIKLSRNEQGQVSLCATDLDTFVTYRVEQTHPGKPVDVLLPFEQLNKSLKGSSGEVIIAQETKEKAKIRYQIGGSPLEQSVATLKPEEFPPSPLITQSPVKMPASFGETLRQAFETSSTDSSRYVLQGAYLDVEQPKCHSIVSTNGRALYAANTFSFDLKESVNIAKHKFLAWSGFLEGECQLAVQPNKSSTGYVQFSTPRWNCITKQIDGQFPKWRQVVPQETESWTKVQLSETAIAQMLNLSSKLPGDDTENRTLQLRIDKDLYLEGRNKEDKDFTGAAIPDVKIKGRSITTALNREYLQTALRCGLNEIRINDELTPIVFCNAGKKMVVMPVKLNGTPTTAASKPAQPQSINQPKPQAAAQPKETMPRPAKNTIATTEPATETKSAISQVLAQVDQIKDTLKNGIRDLNTVGDLLKDVEKEKKTTDKEIEAIRTKLRKIQAVTI